MSGKILVSATLVAAALLATTGAQAQDYPWCAVYNPGGFGDARNCGFTTFAQCQATISGVGGACERNPLYRGRTTEGRGSRRSVQRERY